MIKLFCLFFCFTILGQNAFAQYRDEDIWETENESDVDFRKIRNKKEVFLKDETIIREKDGLTGVLDSGHFTGSDDNMILISIEGSRRLRNLAQFIGLEAVYAHRFQSYWLNFLVHNLNTNFEEISQNKDSGPQRPDDLGANLFILGLGPSYRFRFEAGDYFSKYFHTVSVYGTYTSLTEFTSEVDTAFGLPAEDQNFTGFGLKTNYGIHYRIGQRTHMGLKFSYNINWLKRPPIDQSESDEDLRMLASWLSIGFELGYYF